MKKLIAVACAGLVSFSAFGQGSILFQNVGPGLTTQGQIRDALGALIGAGSAYTAELLAGTSAANVSSFTPVITTTSWAGNGWFGVGGTEKVLPGFAPGSFPFFMVRVWDNAGGTIASYAAAQAAGKAFGASAVPWQLPGPPSTTGLGNPGASPPVTGPALIGMTGFQLVVPEPSTLALLAVGAAALLFRRRK